LEELIRTAPIWEPVPVKDVEPGVDDWDDLIGHIMPVDFSRLSTLLIEGDQWLVEPLIPKRLRTIFQSVAGVGKSLLMLYIAACLATGREVLARPEGNPVVVVYIDSEMTVDDLADRLSDMGFDYENDELLQANLKYYLHPEMGPLDTEDGANMLLGVCQRDQAELVVIDTITSQTAGEENDSSTYRAFARLLTAKLTNLGIASAILDHLGKKPKAGGRGSSAKKDNVDVVWQITADPMGLHLTEQKRRQGWIPSAVRVDREHDPLRFTFNVRSVSEKASKLVQALDELGLPADIGRGKARTAVKEANPDIGIDTNALAEAIRWRKMHPETVQTGAPDRSPDNPSRQVPQTGISGNGDSVDVATARQITQTASDTPSDGTTDTPVSLVGRQVVDAVTNPICIDYGNQLSRKGFCVNPDPAACDLYGANPQAVEQWRINQLPDPM
jgi:hypothetical protein